ncbi:MAG: FAD-binding protein [Planctomycetes bacterium]|nr:FAD-binding protein [Planctomycetota bacterium]
MNYRTRTRWRNTTGNQLAEPLRIYTPQTLGELTEIVREAERCGCTVRAIGSSHSWSDVAVTEGFLVETGGLAHPLALEAGLLRAGVDPTLLVRVEAGMRLRELNELLDQRGLALPNMGGYDAQTVAGVMSTSTHGSGIEFGPLCDFARSIDVVGSGGALYRVEPREGLTDPAGFGAAYPGVRLVQDDAWFGAVRVGMGCLGVMHSATLQVERKFWLKEVRTLSTWARVRADLEAGNVLSENRHYEICINPYRRGSDNLCLVTTRNRAEPPTHAAPDKTQRNVLTEILAAQPLIGRILGGVFRVAPRITPEVLDQALEALVDDEYTNISYKVFNIGAANRLPAYSAEVGVPLDGRHVAAVETILRMADQRRRIGDVYHTAPIALRFVKRTDAYMSMMYGRDTMMIELIMAADTDGGFGLLAAHEEALYALGGRPHWGQFNTLTGSNRLLESMYPKYAEWMAVHAVLNATGVFNSPFSKRVGIAASAYKGEE